MLNISRAAVDLVQAATPLPTDWTNETAVQSYFEGLAGPLAKLVVQIAKAVVEGQLGLIGASQDEVHSAVAEELEARGLTGLNPALIEAIITIVLFIISQLRKER